MHKKEYPYQNRSLKDMKGELWEDIPVLDGAYQISNYGRVKALRRWVERPTTGGFWLKEKLLALTRGAQTKGKRRLRMLTVTIRYERKTFSVRIARLVYFLFVKKFDLEDRKLLVGYKNEDPFDIFPANLVLKTASERITTAYRKDHRDIACFGKNPLSVTQYDLNGRKIASYPSISAVEKVTGISSSHICDALKKKDHFASGFIWYQGNKSNSPIKIHKRITQRVESDKLHNTTISQYDLKGRKIKEFPNIKTAAKSVKVQQNQIRLVVLGQAYSAKGYYWKLGKGEKQINITAILEKRLAKLRKSVCRSVTQYDLNGNKIANYTSVTQAARSLNIHPMNISDVLKRDPDNTCNGFLWRYGNGPQKIKISDIVQRKKLFLDLSARPVTQYDLEGNRVKIHSSLRAVGKLNRFGFYYWNASNMWFGNKARFTGWLPIF